MTSPAVPDDALATLFRDHHGWLLARLYRQMRCRRDAEDLTSETFTQVAASRTPVAAIDEPRAFLTTIAKRLLFHLRRRRDLERVWLEQMRHAPETFAPSPEERALLLETLLLVDRAMQGLPAPARTAFLYSQLDGLSHEQIAQRLGVSLRTVGRYMCQAWQCCLSAAHEEAAQ